MNKLIAIAPAAVALTLAGASVAQPYGDRDRGGHYDREHEERGRHDGGRWRRHHRERVCHMRHHHQVCHWR